MAVVSEGDEGDRFYVVLGGMLSVSQQALGARRVLRPGDYFGEVVGGGRHAAHGDRPRAHACDGRELRPRDVRRAGQAALLRVGDDVASSGAIVVVPAHEPPLLTDARRLIREYAASLPFDLRFQGFDDELATLPGAYAPPRGRLLVARSGGAVGRVRRPAPARPARRPS